MNPITIVVSIIALTYLLYFGFKYDTSDDKINKKRSGLIVYTDYGTGMQYLSTWSGTLIPRLDVDGNHVSKNMEN